MAMFGSTTSKSSQKTGSAKFNPTDFEVCMHGSVTVSAKGQITIPKEVREMLDINEGDTLLTISKYGKFFGFVKSEDIENFIALLKKECNLE